MACCSREADQKAIRPRGLRRQSRKSFVKAIPIAAAISPSRRTGRIFKDDVVVELDPDFERLSSARLADHFQEIEIPAATAVQRTERSSQLGSISADLAH